MAVTLCENENVPIRSGEFVPCAEAKGGVLRSTIAMGSWLSIAVSTKRATGRAMGGLSILPERFTLWPRFWPGNHNGHGFYPMWKSKK